MSSISSRVYQHPVVSIRVVSSQGASGSEYCQWDSVQSTASKRSIYNQYRWEKSQSSVYPVLTRVLLVRSIVGRANLRISLQDKENSWQFHIWPTVLRASPRTSRLVHGLAHGQVG